MASDDDESRPVQTATSRSTAFAVFLVVVVIAVLALVILGTIFVVVEFGRHP